MRSKAFSATDVRAAKLSHAHCQPASLELPLDDEAARRPGGPPVVPMGGSVRLGGALRGTKTAGDEPLLSFIGH